MDAPQGRKLNVWWQSLKNAVSCVEQVIKATTHKAAAVQPPTIPSRKLSKLDEPDMQDTAGEVKTNS